jgi:hypothetical protein
MTADKITLRIETNTLSIESVPALLQELAANLRADNVEGCINKSDGDMIEWTTQRKLVVIELKIRDIPI